MSSPTTSYPTLTDQQVYATVERRAKWKGGAANGSDTLRNLESVSKLLGGRPLSTLATEYESSSRILLGHYRNPLARMYRIKAVRFALQSGLPKVLKAEAHWESVLAATEEEEKALKETIREVLANAPVRVGASEGNDGPCERTSNQYVNSLAHAAAKLNAPDVKAMITSPEPRLSRFGELDNDPCEDSRESNDNDAYTALRLPTLAELSIEISTMEGGGDDQPLLSEQKKAFDTITRAGTGFFLITGGPGSGKMFLTRRLAKHFRGQGDDMKVLLTGSTGASSVRLSKHASTVHSTFALSKYGPLLIGINHRCRSILEQAKVVFVDEMSMLDTDLVGGLFFQLRKIHHCFTNSELFKKILVVFVGDHAQLPPVCKHKTDGYDKVCELCHIGHSLWWPMMTKIELNCHPRTAGDQDFSDYLDISRKSVYIIRLNIANFASDFTRCLRVRSGSGSVTKQSDIARRMLSNRPSDGSCDVIFTT